MQIRVGITVTILLLAVSCRTSPPAKAVQTIDPAKLVDLSYSFDERTIYWPNAAGFRHRKDTWAVTSGGYWYAAGEFTSAEHGGTHVDSPIHFGQGKRTLDQIPLAELVGPAGVIDVAAKTATERDYRASAEDIRSWEREHGTVARGSIIVFRTGWGKYWPDRKQYLGSDVPGDVTHLHFPGISREAAELLVQRGVCGVGIDTPSLDYGPSSDFIVHQVLNGADIYGVENIANADRLPAAGATLIVMPMKIAEGSGGPSRVAALLP
jgi:kynurenine formamidase